jgi:NAD(P)H-nitrite reductase large subunit
MPFMDTAIAIDPSSMRGIETALALKEAGKDAVLITETDRLLPELMDEATSTLLARLVEKRGVRVLFNTVIEDILGEVEVKAVRFQGGKVMACETVILENAAPDFRFLEGSELVMAERIPVTASLRTNVETAYALDGLAQLESPKVTGDVALSREDIERQGEVAALAAFGEAVRYDRAPTAGRVLLERVFSIAELSEISAMPEATVISGSGPDPAGGSGG